MTLNEMIAWLKRRVWADGDDTPASAILAELERRRPVCEREGHLLRPMTIPGSWGPILCERCGRKPEECR